MRDVMYEFSAGGVILDGCKVVIIRTRTSRGRHVWTFPKGRLEAGESEVEAALREVREETGYDCRMKCPLGATTYWFRSGETQIKKTVRWFLLEVSEKIGWYNRAEVEEVRWIPIRQAYEKLTHRGDRKLLAGVEAIAGCG